jgi:hypothetical protein
MDREHGEIITALEERDAERGVALMRSHIETSRTRFLESYNSPLRTDDIASEARAYRDRLSAAKSQGDM